MPIRYRVFAASRKASLFAGSLALATAGAVPARGAPCGERCVRVDVITATVSNVAAHVALTGDIEAKYQSNIAFRINGKISQRLVDIGAHVTRNQVLARIDPRDQRANFDTVQASLASARALLAQAKVGFERQQTLYRQGFTTKPSYDQAEQTLRTQLAAVASGEAALGTAREQFGYTDLVAGADGIVVARNAEAGQVVQAGQTIFTLAQDGARDAVFDVYEALLSGPPGNGEVTVLLGTDPSVRTTGKVREIAPSVDSASGTVKVKVELDHVPARMSLGASVVGTADLNTEKAIVLPGSALFYWQGKPAAWVVDAEGKAAPRPIAIARYAGTSIVVSKGLEPGARVIVAGIQFLHPGQPVEIADGGRS